jgi:lipopolysaccharide transport system ATP-binding protein
MPQAREAMEQNQESGNSAVFFSMSEPIIEVSHLSKNYRLGAIGATTLRESFSRWRERKRGGTPGADQKEFWALRDVSFTVQPGEIVGIVGRNGAGKSTLLKILSRITEPAGGRATLRGRVASLLEVGTGFHPDLTGRENVFLNGAILGMTKAEIARKFDEIVAFAEVEQFIDTPVKRYSSGMYVRLAFAVAAHLEPEILIVDEVLAVGDSAFQKKCLGKIGEVSHEAGRTVLFVSHNMGVVANLCNRAILLKAGKVLRDGPAATVVGAYIESGATVAGEATWAADDPEAGSERMRLRRARILSGGKVTGDVPIDGEVTLEYDFEIIGGRCNAGSSIHLFDKQGVWVLCSGPTSAELEPGTYRHAVTIPANFLNDGLYSFSIILLRNVSQIEAHQREALTFCVHETGEGRGEYGGVINGCVRPQLPWSSERLKDEG